MKKTIEVVTCDICGKEENCTNISYPVMFYTEQTEGRSCSPYISNQKIDICEDCLGKTVRVHATGAQGHNTYYIG